MWYPSTVTVAAASEPIDLATAKAQLRVDFDDDNELIERLIEASRNHVEKYCGIRLATETVTAKCDAFSDMAWLPDAPVQSVTSIVYTDTAGAEQTLADTVYELRADGLEASIVLKYGQQWPAILPGSRITLTAVVGYATVPPAVMQAVILNISESYEQREPTPIGDRTTFDNLLCNFRR